LPDAVAACVGGGSNAIRHLHRLVPDAGVRLVGYEAGGDGVETGGTPHHHPGERRVCTAARPT